MKYYFLTDDSEKSLSPFFSKVVLSASIFSVVITVAVIFVFWPRQPLSSFILAETIPHTFFLIFTTILIVYCYVNLCCGCGDMVQRGYNIIKYPTEKSTYEKEIGFYQYGLIESLLHTLILLLPFVPLLILPTAISAVSLISFFKAVFILYTASLICRLIGFLVYLFWGRFSTLGYFVARAVMIVLIFGTIFFAPFINPLRRLYILNQPSKSDGFAFISYLVIVLLAILCLVVSNHILVKRNIQRAGSRPD
jgi:hypothetical protein